MRRKGIISSDLAKVDLATITEEVRQQLKRDLTNSPGHAIAPKIPGHVNKRNDQTEETLISMKYNFYEQRRQQLIESIIIERKRILFEEQNGMWQVPEVDPNLLSIDAISNAKSFKSKSTNKKKNMTSIGGEGERSLSPDAKQSTMIANEMKALEKIKQRQQKEIENMMEQEKRNEEIRQRNKLKELKEQEREYKR